jgi:hypothetical protein
MYVWFSPVVYPLQIYIKNLNSSFNQKALIMNALLRK